MKIEKTRHLSTIRHWSGRLLTEYKARLVGTTENADFNASKNISFRAAVNQPMVLCLGN